MEAVAAERAGGVAPVVQGAGLGLPAPPASATRGSEWLRIGSVALAVRDLDRMEAFYRYAVGLQDVAREPGLVRLGVGERAFLDLLHRPDALPDDPAGAGLFHTAFLLPSRADLGRWLAHAARLRLRLDGAADHLVSEAVYLRDPEGNGIEVYADRPRTAWRWTDVPANEGDGHAGGRPSERRVEMANQPLDRAGLLRDAERDGRPWTGAPDGTSIGHVHLRVGDAAEAERFYGGVLGLDLTVSGTDAAFLSTGGYHHHLAVNQWRSRGAGPRDPRRAGLASVTFDVADGASGSAGRLPAAVAAHVGGSALLDPWGTALRFRAA